jgi:hypothetical protein
MGNRVAREYGLAFTLDEAGRALHAQIGADLPAYNGDDSWELPVTGTFLVGQSRTVRLASVDPNFFHRLDPPVVIALLSVPREGIAEDGHLRSPPTRIDVRWVAWAKFDRKAVPKRTPSHSFFVMTTCGGHDETVSTPRKKYHLIVEIQY